MKAFARKPLNAAFTLIELLIVVAIIAILAAIAVPNFLEAQVRAKMSRCAADMRTVRTGLESYRVDNNHYPETDFGGSITQIGAGMDRLSTPVSYLTSVPPSPFLEDKIGGNTRHANNPNRKVYLYIRAAKPGLGTLANGFTVTDSPVNGIDDSYETDRVTYIAQADPARSFQVRTQGFWSMKSVGPDNRDDRDTAQTGWPSSDLARPYDPTNGTVSAGDVVIFSDTQGFAKGAQ